MHVYTCTHTGTGARTHAHAHTDHDTWVLGEAGQATFLKIMVEMVHMWVCW